MNVKDVVYKRFRGSGPGGQHKNKTENGCEATHEPTGIKVRIDGRKHHQNQKKATRELEKAVKKAELEDKNFRQNEERRDRLRDDRTVRTYNVKRQRARDNRSGKEVDLQDMFDGLVDFRDFSTGDKNE